jgi:hypothetical protein
MLASSERLTNIGCTELVARIAARVSNWNFRLCVVGPKEPGVTASLTVPSEVHKDLPAEFEHLVLAAR